jgi:hypothetical protein
MGRLSRQLAGLTIAMQVVASIACGAEVAHNHEQDLEYRIVDQHLVLRDMHANIIVDYMYDVMCATC